MHEQTLFKIVEPIKKTTISRLNKGKKWKHGYDKEHDLIVLSHSGQIGEIIEIQGFQIALPKQPKEVYSCSKIQLEQKWKQFPPNLDFKKIKCR